MNKKKKKTRERREKRNRNRSESEILESVEVVKLEYRRLFLHGISWLIDETQQLHTTRSKNSFPPRDRHSGYRCVGSHDRNLARSCGLRAGFSCLIYRSK